MSPMNLLKTSCLLFALLAWTGLSIQAEDKPNVLFIFADDQTFHSIHALGEEGIETPNLDRLAERGTTFTHAYNMGSWSGAVCVASRHMLNTGLFVWKAEQAANALRGKGGKKEQAPAETPNFQEKGWMWSQLMKKAGYDTYFTGKWHVQANAEKIFDVARHVRPGMPAQTPEGYNRPIQGQEDVWNPADPKFGGYWEGGKHWSEVVADDATEYLGMASKDEDPFFMYIAFNAPHDPRQSPQEYLDKYPVEKMAVPVNFLPEYPYNEGMKSGRGLRDEKLAPFPRTEYAVKVHRREYYSLITHLDTQVGRVLDALEASGKADNTYIFYSADHGLAVGHHGLIGKQNMFDHSVRVPLMVVGPGIPKGKQIDTRVYLQDIMRTSLDLAKAEVPEHVQFKSLMPAIEGKEGSGYDSIYGAYLDGQRAVTNGEYKLILYPLVPKALLFNLKEDPEEMENLLEDPQYEAKAKELFQDLLKLKPATGDELDFESAFPELNG